MTGTTHIVDLADIVCREDWQVRRSIDPTKVKEYANAYRNGACMPPIALARIEGALYLLDGWHRLAAVRRNGGEDIKATVAGMTEDEARWSAAAGNLRHGLPLKSREMRVVFRVFVQTGQHRQGRRFKSYRDIARDLGGSRGYTTIRNWMHEDFPAVFRAMGETGRQDDKDMRDPRKVPETFLEAKGAVDHAAALSPRLTQTERGELLEHLREAYEKIAGGRPWEPRSSEEPMDF